MRNLLKRLERETGFEPATLALARRCSTTELFPLTFSTERGGILLSATWAVKQRQKVGFFADFHVTRAMGATRK